MAMAAKKKQRVNLEPGKFLFRPQSFWQEVLPEHVLDIPWLERGKGADEQRNFARHPNPDNITLSDKRVRDEELLEVADPELVEAAVCVGAREDEPAVAKMLRSISTWGDLPKVRRLLASAHVSSLACDGAMCETSGLGHEGLVKELLRARASANASDGATGKSALHFACAQGHEPVATLLIGAKADLLAKDVGGMTPCQLAREQDFGMMAKRLEKHMKDAFRNHVLGGVADARAHSHVFGQASANLPTPGDASSNDKPAEKKKEVDLTDERVDLTKGRGAVAKEVLKMGKRENTTEKVPFPKAGGKIHNVVQG